MTQVSPLASALPDPRGCSRVRPGFAASAFVLTPLTSNQTARRRWDAACQLAGLDPTRKFAPNFRVRGQAAASGSFPENIAELCDDANHPVAAIWIHADNDVVNPIENSYAARDVVLERNGCTDSATTPFLDDQLPGLCVRYEGCPEEYPVVFCTLMGRAQSDLRDIAIPAFTEFF